MSGAARLRKSQLTRREALQGVVASGLWGLLARSARANDLKVGAPAPEATLATLDGRRIATPQLLGEVVILTFWATWCEPCHEELPLLSAYAARHVNAGLQVLGFTLDGTDQLSEVQSVARTLSFPVGLLERSSAPGYGRIWRLPVNFAIDRNGRLAMDGWKEKKPAWTAERLEEVVSPLLGTGK
jgi:thiol-disulfide isomerase/thioredoxin